MTQEEKDLLLKDLCARLPYGVKCSHKNKDIFSLTCIDLEYNYIYVKDGGFKIGEPEIKHIKPYLFPISSMTVEQKEFIKNKFCYDWDIDDHPYSLWTHCIDIGDIDELIDWFHKNHIDYRGLIKKGLAIDATGLNIY